MELLRNTSTQVNSPAERAPDEPSMTVNEYVAAIHGTTAADRHYATELSGTLIKLINAIHQSKTRAFAQGDTEHSDFVLLIKLVKEGPRRASDLAEQMCFDPSTVSRQVAAMVKSGLIERRADPDDGRASILVPTEAGRARIDEHTKMRGMVIAPLVAGWSESERELFARLLEEFSRGISSNLEIVKETVGRLMATGASNSNASNPIEPHVTSDQQYPRRNS